MNKRVEVGQMVKSIAGRDQGRYYLVLEIDQAKGTVLLVDGAKRGADHPKRKNINHIQITRHIAREFSEQAAAGITPRDQETQRHLREMEVD